MTVVSSPVPTGTASIADVTREDIIAAVRTVFTGVDSEGLSRVEAIRETAKQLGFARTGRNIAKAIHDALRAASSRGVVRSERGRVYADCRGIDDYLSDLLAKYFLAAIGRTWWDREEAIATAARYLGFRRTGKKIREAFSSVIAGLLRTKDLEKDGGMIRRR